MHSRKQYKQERLSLRHYEPSFKKAVILYSEQKGIRETKIRYGISETNIRRWRQLKKQILDKAAEPTRKSMRIGTSHPKPKRSEQREASSENSNSLDSMPLQQRIEATKASTSTETPEPVLQSQPLSPTKLKVTRQGAKLSPQVETNPPTPQPPSEVCLKWNSHYQVLQSTFPLLFNKEQFVDATLVAEGKTLKCHKMVLSACSTYFEDVLQGISPFQHPVLFMKDIPFWILKSLCDFMYAGEVHIHQNKLEELLKVAEMLKIKGLAVKPEEPLETKQPKTEPTTPVVSKEETEIKEEKQESVKPEKPERKKEEKKRISKEKEETPQKVLQRSPQKVPQRPSRSHHFSRLSHNSNVSKRPERSKDKEKEEAPVPRRLERNRDRDKTGGGSSSTKTDDSLDPLDLLEAVYEEEVKKDPKPNVPSKIRENKHVSGKKTMKKVKKRKYIDDREESPSPIFASRKGTRSRPNVKMPKYFHSNVNEQKLKESTDTPIVWEPHTAQPNPLMQFEEIKAEPIDIEEDSIEVEESMVSFCEGEEIIGSYDSPIVNLKDTSHSDGAQAIAEPVITNICTVDEGKRTGTLKIVDINEISGKKRDISAKPDDIQEIELISQQLDEKTDQDPLKCPEKVIEPENTEPKEKEQPNDITTTSNISNSFEQEESVDLEQSERSMESEDIPSIVISKVESIQEAQDPVEVSSKYDDDKKKNEEISRINDEEADAEGQKENIESMEVDSRNDLGIQIENVVSEAEKAEERKCENPLQSENTENTTKEDSIPNDTVTVKATYESGQERNNINSEDVPILENSYDNLEEKQGNDEETILIPDDLHDNLEAKGDNEEMSKTDNVRDNLEAEEGCIGTEINEDALLEEETNNDIGEEESQKEITSQKEAPTANFSEENANDIFIGENTDCTENEENITSSSNEKTDNSIQDITDTSREILQDEEKIKTSCKEQTDHPNEDIQDTSPKTTHSIEEREEPTGVNKVNETPEVPAEKYEIESAENQTTPNDIVDQSDRPEETMQKCTGSPIETDCSLLDEDKLLEEEFLMDTSLTPSTSQPTEEKTLEMIVNDLNESLRKDFGDKDSLCAEVSEAMPVEDDLL